MIDLEVVIDQAILDLRHSLGEQAMCIFIDPTLNDPLAPSGPLCDAFDDAVAKARVSKARLPHIHDNFDPNRQPYILRLDSEPAAQRLFLASVRLACEEMALERVSQAQPFVMQAQARTVCAWFTANDSIKRDAAALADAARIFKPDGQPWYLRFWDPRVVWHLPRVLGPEDCTAMRNALCEWRYLSATSRIRQVPAFAGADTAPAPRTSGAPSVATTRWRAVERQWASLRRIELVNRVIASLQGWPLQIDDALATRIERHFECCIAQGFTSADDQVVFSSAALILLCH